MPHLIADARFLANRAAGLVHRGLLSLRTRGLRASWARLRAQLLPPPPALRESLYLPAAEPFAPFALATSEAPVASIVIPVYGQSAHTVACLRALAAHPPEVPFEVLVVDDASTDDTPALLPRVEGLRYHRRESNGGFIAACNDGAVLARGTYLVLLNNDTVPQPGWLDALLATFDEHPDAGLVGAQLLYPDGRLQEAGGVVFNDGNAWNYGRFGDPSDPRYAYLREVDYASGAAIAIPRELFLGLGGFDRRYAPAYYEDTDLAFAVRAAGRRVLYQPAARVVHDEGTSSGTDTSSGVKANQARNREVFLAHRREALAALPAPHEPSPASLHRGQRQVLVIDALTPQPDRDSGSLRLVNLMRLLREEGAHVVFLPANRRHDGRYTDALRRMGVEVWCAPHAARAPAWLAAHGARFDVAMVCRHYVASEFFPLLRRQPFFTEFDDVEVWEVLRICCWRTVGEGVQLVREGDADQRFGLLLEGSVELSMGGRRVTELGPGEVFGEQAWLDQLEHRQTLAVVTLTPVTYLEMNPSALALASDEVREQFRRQISTALVRRMSALSQAIARSGPAARSGEFRRGDAVELKLADD